MNKPDPAPFSGDIEGARRRLLELACAACQALDARMLILRAFIWRHIWTLRQGPYCSRGG